MSPTIYRTGYHSIYVVNIQPHAPPLQKQHKTPKHTLFGQNKKTSHSQKPKNKTQKTIHAIQEQNKNKQKLTIHKQQNIHPIPNLHSAQNHTEPTTEPGKRHTSTTVVSRGKRVAHVVKLKKNKANAPLMHGIPQIHENTNRGMGYNTQQSVRTVNLKKLSNIYAWISSHKYYPTEALFKEEQGSVLLKLTITTSGIITDIRIEKPSKYTALTEAAVNMLRASSPIPHRLLIGIKLPIRAYLKIVYRINFGED